MSQQQHIDRKTKSHSRLRKRVNSQQNVLLPSIPIPDQNGVEKKKSRAFDLGGMHNASLPKYEPLKDKNLKFFFEKPTIRKIVNRNLDAISNHDNKSSKLISNLSHHHQNLEGGGKTLPYEQLTLSKNKRTNPERSKSFARIQRYPRNLTQGDQGATPPKHNIISKEEFLHYIDDIRQKIKNSVK